MLVRTEYMMPNDEVEQDRLSEQHPFNTYIASAKLTGPRHAASAVADDAE